MIAHSPAFVVVAPMSAGANRNREFSTAMDDLAVGTALKRPNR